MPGAGAVLDLLRERGVPQPLDALTAAFSLQNERDVELLRKRLAGMVASGRLLQNRRGEYCLIEKLGLLTGVVSAHRDGYGFVLVEDGGGDVFLSPAEMRQLLDGDRVAVRLSGKGMKGRRAGVVTEILARGRQSAVGRYVREHGLGYVVEAGHGNRPFLVPDSYRAGAEAGQLVKIEIITYPTARREPQGRVVRLLGRPEDDPAVATEAALEMYGLPTLFAEETLEAAAALGKVVPPRDKAGRIDLREVPLVTIDGADARDFDDAVYAEPLDDGGWLLLVAIADVSHYVRPGDALDQEALQRGTSVYFPDRVLPMLPPALSNGLCSLNPGVDRLAVVCEMQVSAKGVVTGSRFYRAVMRSRRRLTYAEVQAARDGDRKLRHRLRGVQAQIDHLYGVYQSLARARRRRGALDLELPETFITLGKDGRIKRLGRHERKDAHRLIEECMVAANVQAARFLRRHRLATLYRVHADPDDEKFETLRVMLQALGIKVSAAARSKPRELNAILGRLRGRPDYLILATALLRTLSQAVYQPANIGHFGLALEHYAHFTSPIRRYPDLLVHRGITHLLAGGKPGAFEHDLAGMQQLGKVCSERERRAEEASRYVEVRYKCAWAKEHIGEVMEGVVSALTHFGLFVTLTEMNVDGLVHVSSLHNDYYHLQQGGLSLVGERSGQAYRLGDRLQLRILRVDVDEARIDLAIEGREAAPPEERKKAAEKQRSTKGRRRR